MRFQTARFPITVFLLLAFIIPAAAQDSALDAANEALRVGDYREARRLFRPLVDSVTGDRREEITGYFETFLATGEYDEGLSAVNESLEKSPDDPYLLHMKGRFLDVKGEYDAAGDAFVSAWEKKNDYVRNLLSIGELLEKTGSRGEALSVYTLIVREHQQNKLRTSYPVAVAAEAYARLGDFHEANDVFRVAYQLDPRETRTLFLWADLFRRKYNNADARRTFEEAIAVNPNSAELYVGYARSFESLTQWEALASHALEINPNSVDARNILAEIAILDGDYDRATEILTGALEINPVYERSLANLATVHHLRGDSEAFSQLELIARQTNPQCGGFYVGIAENCIYRFRYADAVEFCRQAVMRERDNWRAYALLGSNILRLGRIEEARVYLERAYEGDPFDIFARNSLELLDDYAGFEMVESEHFSLLINSSESVVLARPILDLAEECYDSLSVRYPYRPAEKIRLEAYDDHDDFAVRISGLPGIGLLGVCFGDVVAFDTPRAQQDSDYNWAMTLWHEIAHVMALGISDNRVPRWFTEGLSVYEEKQARPEWGRDMELELYVAYDLDLLLSLEEINQGFTRPSYPEQVLITYYQSAQIIEYLAGRYEFGKIVELLDAFRENDDWEAAFPLVLGETVESVNRAFFADMREKRRAYDRALSDIPPILSVQREENGESGSAADTKNPFFRALLDGNKLLNDGELEKAEEQFRDAIDIFPNYTQTGNPYTGLAAVYRLQGDTSQLADILKQYLAVTNYGAAEARELAELLDARGDTGGAVYYYLRSMEVAPYDIQAQVRLADLFAKTAQYDEEAETRRVVLALNPIDRARAHYFLALSLYNGENVPDAKIEVLRSLEIAPGFRDAQKLLLECVE